MARTHAQAVRQDGLSAQCVLRVRASVQVWFDGRSPHGESSRPCTHQHALNSEARECWKPTWQCEIPASDDFSDSHGATMGAFSFVMTLRGHGRIQVSRARVLSCRMCLISDSVFLVTAQGTTTHTDHANTWTDFIALVGRSLRDAVLFPLRTSNSICEGMRAKRWSTRSASAAGPAVRIHTLVCTRRAVGVGSRE